MGKQTYMVLNHEGEHEYDIVKELTDEGEKITTYRSNSKIWYSHVRGEKIMSITNNGNGIKFDKKIKELDYGDLVVLRLLINFEHQTDANPVNGEKYRLIENKTLIEI
jgi:hypothetical protein